MVERRGEDTNRTDIDWGSASQRLILIAILLALAIALVVGTQNFDERAQVHFLIWTLEFRLVTFFLLSAGVGILADESLRRLLRSLRTGNGAQPASQAGRPAPRR